MYFPVSGILVNKDGVPEEEENFDEAIKAVNSALVPTKVIEVLYLLLVHSPGCKIHSVCTSCTLICHFPYVYLLSPILVCLAPVPCN